MVPNDDQRNAKVSAELATLSTNKFVLKTKIGGYTGWWMRQRYKYETGSSITDGIYLDKDGYIFWIEIRTEWDIWWKKTKFSRITSIFEELESLLIASTLSFSK